jgi:ACR3 family arsenite transporter
MGIFERFLSLWVGLSMLCGVLLGAAFPDFFEIVSRFEFAHVNVLIAVLIWLMIYPMMIQIDLAAVRNVGRNPRGLVLTLTINWLVKPFSMAALAVFFMRYVFADWVDPTQAEEYIAGLILLGVAPCTAMVFVWSQLTKGDPQYTLLQVAVNDLIMVFAFAPLAGLLLGVTDVGVPWSTLVLSVLLYVVVPLVAGLVTRRRIQRHPRWSVERVVQRLKPGSVVGLLATVLLLFAFQAPTLLAIPQTVVLLAVPLLVQSYAIFGVSYFWALRWRLPHEVAAPAALIGTSNFFELAVAVAVGLYGLHSGAALATVVGVLIEVPVMLSLVALANRSRHWFVRPEPPVGPRSFA